MAIKLIIVIWSGVQQNCFLQVFGLPRLFLWLLTIFVLLTNTRRKMVFTASSVTFRLVVSLFLFKQLLSCLGIWDAKFWHSDMFLPSPISRGKNGTSFCLRLFTVVPASLFCLVDASLQKKSEIFSKRAALLKCRSLAMKKPA